MSDRVGSAAKGWGLRIGREQRRFGELRHSLSGVVDPRSFFDDAGSVLIARLNRGLVLNVRCGQPGRLEQVAEAALWIGIAACGVNAQDQLLNTREAGPTQH